MLNFVFVLVAALLYYTLKNPFFQQLEPVSYSVSLPDKLDGALKPNELLEKTERLFENELHWPESFAVYNNKIYSGLGDGRIVSISGSKVANISRTGKDCEGQHQEDVCGRPLGMQFDKKGLLYVVDAYIGLLTVNVNTGRRNVILPANTLVNDKPLTFLNNLYLNEQEQTVYLTQSSSKWNISMVLISIFEHDTSGRLLKYNLKTKEVTELLTGLAFPNGVEISHDGKSLLVAEASSLKIFKYHISGAKKGTREDLPMILPGEPDNISRNQRNNYWVALASCRTKESPSFYDRFSKLPLLRQCFLHFHRFITTPLQFFSKLLPYKSAKEVIFELHNGRLVADLPVSYGIVLEFNDKGEIVGSMQSPSGKVSHLSEVLEHNGYLYLGSWRNQYVGRLPVQKYTN